MLWLKLLKYTLQNYLKINMETAKEQHETHVAVLTAKKLQTELEHLKEKHALELSNLKLTNKKLKNEWWKSPLMAISVFFLGIISPLLIEWLRKLLGI